jgi:hypothetical protein
VILPYRQKPILCLLQITEENEYIEDEECHKIAKRCVKNQKNLKQDIIDLAKRFEEIE